MRHVHHTAVASTLPLEKAEISMDPAARGPREPERFGSPGTQRLAHASRASHRIREHVSLERAEISIVQPPEHPVCPKSHPEHRGGPHAPRASHRTRKHVVT
jgi:hypothetical protein